jgi:hypothetical protein
MPWQKVGSVVVIVAHQLNPSIISQLWLSRNGFVGDEDFLPGCIYSDVLVQVRSKPFHLLVLPEQLQFVPNVPEAQQQQLVQEKLGGIVRALPHTPYRAIGLNVTWHLTPRDGDMSRLTRELFYRLESPLFGHFDVPGAHFGSYLSKDIHGFRLKLDVKPLLVTLIDERQESRVQFAFNFHADLGEDGATQIQQLLTRWNDINHEAETITNSIEPRG